MSDLEAQLEAVSADQLTGLVRKALHNRNLRVVDWSYGRLGWEAINPATAGIYRFAGTARDGAETTPWALVLKIIHWVDLSGGPFEKGYLTEPGDWNYWKREGLVFQSGILDTWRGGLVPVQCYDVVEQADGSVWIWLEEVHDAEGASWDLERQVLAARHFGEFNGAHLARLPVPGYPWLCRSFVRQWTRTGLALGYLDLFRDRDTWAHPRIKAAVPYPIGEEAHRLLEDSDRLLAVLEGLPQTLSHLDCHRSNLFARRGPDGRDRTVVIDWSYLGLAAAGEDLGMQVAGNLFNLEVEPSKAAHYQEAALAAYVAGLLVTGWQGNEDAVRFAYAVAASLRYVPFGAYMISRVLDETEPVSWVDNWGEKRGRTMDEVLHGWGQVLRFLLDVADEARRLVERV